MLLIRCSKVRSGTSGCCGRGSAMAPAPSKPIRYLEQLGVLVVLYYGRMYRTCKHVPPTPYYGLHVRYIQYYKMGQFGVRYSGQLMNTLSLSLVRASRG